ARWLEPVAKVLVLHLCRKLCRSLSRTMPDPTKVATKAADKVFSSTDFCNSLPLARAQEHNAQRRTTRNGQPATNINLLPAAVGAGAVEINQDVPRLRAFARADEAAVFQFIHDARGAGVAETQAALQQ